MTESLKRHSTLLTLICILLYEVFIETSSSQVGYFTGSNQQSLPTSIMSELDDVLVPVIHNAASHHRRRSVSVELLFKILRLL